MRLLHNCFWRETWICLPSLKAGWHHCSEDASILRATPAGYSSLDNPRQLLPDVGPVLGGGIVVFFKSSLRVTQVQLTLVPSSFEALCLIIATPRGPVIVLTVYRPSTTTLTLQFYEEFASVLEDLISRNSRLLILGDFNIHLEDSVSSNSLHFSQLLAQFGLHQHISEPTRSSGGWLDLVITSDEEQILDLHVQPPTVSDHAFIKFVLPSIHMQPIHSIRMLRGWKALIHRPSALLYATRFYQYQQRLWIFLLLTSSSISIPRPQPACLTQCYRDIQLKVALG